MKKIIIILWFMIALPTFALTYYYNQDLFTPQKQNKQIQKVEATQQTFEPVSAPQITQNESKPIIVPQIIATSTTTVQTITNSPKAQVTEIPTKIEIPKTQEATPDLTPTPIQTILPTPIVTPLQQAFIQIAQVGNYNTDLKVGDTAFSVLARTAGENNFQISYQNYNSLGAFVNCIAGICNSNGYYWTFYYNGRFSNVGASSQSIYDGDITAWKFEKR